ncbi:MAG: hypothetical protein ACRC2R_13930 [Xenococcaceae cyanobacterium]
MLVKVDLLNKDPSVLFYLETKDFTELIEDEPFFIDLKEYGLAGFYTYIFYAKNDYLAELAAKKFLEPRFKNIEGKVTYVWLNSDNFQKLQNDRQSFKTNTDYGFSIVLCREEGVGSNE